ncbi:response regulator [Rubellimicrobium rubrum]|uniref:Response regulator n=1 Tax=Rubellimicrobium rubrum TaxID=2585369 RepID=A0A5C4MU14_9RHOB|nr:response regulator [Rubellimicrobium rubrum]TNC48430.1 response regulator [Rubellimicrobium rubrum]
MHELSTILLVEDNEDDADLILYAFKKSGIENPVTRVAHGDAAVHYIEGTGPFADRALHPLPALILLDLKLPRRSGLEVLKVIRDNEVARHTPVVILTSSDQNTDIKRAYDLSANAYLVKPVSRDALLALVQTLEAFWIKLNRVVGP